MWAVLAAPLVLSLNVRALRPFTFQTFTNQEVIAVNQDPLGKQGWRYRAQTGHEIWVRELSNGEWAVALFNTGATAADLTLEFPHMWFMAGKRTVRDVWGKKDVGTNEQKLTVRVDSHDIALFRLSAPAK